MLTRQVSDMRKFGGINHLSTGFKLRSGREYAAFVVQDFILASTGQNAGWPSGVDVGTFEEGFG